MKLIAASLAATTLLTISSAGAETLVDMRGEYVEVHALTDGEVKLAKMLEGRVAGEPQSCISQYRNSGLTMIDGTALVYKVGGTLYVNLTSDPRSINDDDVLVRRSSFGNRLCDVDVITTVDRTGGFYTGNIFLGDFIPYRKEN